MRSRLFIPVTLAVLGLVVWTSQAWMTRVQTAWPSFPGFSIALADDDEEDEEDEHEDDEDEDDEYDDDRSSNTSTSTSTTPATPIVQYRTVTKVITITEPGYDTDSDGDILVDAIDPDPNKDQHEYFTDTDGDGVPNAFDQHHDEDDFAYFESAHDDDRNGLIDSIEDFFDGE